MTKILTDHDEIRQWAEARAGNPMTMEVPDGTGDTRTLLQITFGQHAINADSNEGPDRPGGWTLSSWDDWFAAFASGEHRGIRVQDESPGVLDTEFEFVGRDEE